MSEQLLRTLLGFFALSYCRFQCMFYKTDLPAETDGGGGVTHKDLIMIFDGVSFCDQDGKIQIKHSIE